MWVATTKGEGILFMVLALLMLGTWPALFNLVERRGRLPTHTCAPAFPCWVLQLCLNEQRAMQAACPVICMAASHTRLTGMTPLCWLLSLHRG